MKKLLLILCAAFIASCAAVAGCSMTGSGGNSTTGKAPSTITQNNTDDENEQNGETPEMPDLPELPELPEPPEHGDHAMRPEPRPFRGRRDNCEFEEGERVNFMRIEIGGRVPFDFDRFLDNETDESKTESGDIWAKDVTVRHGKRKKRPDEGKEKIAPRDEIIPDNNADDGE